MPANRRYLLRVAAGSRDILAAQTLRAVCFNRIDATEEADRFDDICQHFLIEDTLSGAVVCCFRVLVLAVGDVDQSYSAQFYALPGLRARGGQMIELGRFCIHPDVADPDVLRTAWGGLTRFVDARDISMLFGCSSFRGIDAGAYGDSFSLLQSRYLAPVAEMPLAKAPEIHRFSDENQCAFDPRNAMRMMPPLLRTYLMMGGWVSDHAVVDRSLNTLHVFTGVEIGKIPETRKRLLRALAH